MMKDIRVLARVLLMYFMSDHSVRRWMILTTKTCIKEMLAVSTREALRRRGLK